MMMRTIAEDLLGLYLSSTGPSWCWGRILSTKSRANSLGSTGIQRDELVGAVESMLVGGE